MTRAVAVVENAVQWPANEVRRVSVASLVPFAKNARTHSATQIAQIAASIQEWGWTTPVLVDGEGVIIAGHGRLLLRRSWASVESRS
ncbi:ParB N-terminal domain-containing protein [Bradyrhizobium sp. CSA112]|nr:ParB N-terminal domain-containing protein [Bradyrhizobium sp. CSA112]